MVKISKTYVPKEKEKYMCEKHLTFFKQKLTNWKSELVKANNQALYNSSLDDNSTSAEIVDLCDQLRTLPKQLRELIFKHNQITEKLTYY